VAAGSSSITAGTLLTSVGQHQRGHGQRGCVGQVHAPRHQRLQRLAGQAGLFQRVVDHEQAHEQHQQFPVDQAHHARRMEALAQQQHAGADQRGHVTRQRR
jgi:hypothetical protein